MQKKMRLKRAEMILEMQSLSKTMIKTVHNKLCIHILYVCLLYF